MYKNETYVLHGLQPHPSISFTIQNNQAPLKQVKEPTDSTQ